MTLDPRFSVLVSGYTFFESPRWHDDHLWLSDFYTHQIIRVDLQGRVEKVADVPQQPSGMGWLPDGRLLVISMRDRQVLRREADGRLVTHADLSSVAGGHVNDMVVDAHGRAYVGNFGFDLMGGGAPQTATLARVDPDGSVHVAADGLYFPNGSMITPDGRTLIVGETMGNRISAFDIQPDGQLGPRRDWAAWGPLPPMTDVPSVLGALKAAPDGATLDAEGCGSPTPWATAWCAWHRAAKSWRAFLPETRVPSPARSAAPMAAPCSSAWRRTSSSTRARPRAKRPSGPPP